MSSQFFSDTPTRDSFPSSNRPGFRNGNNQGFRQRPGGFRQQQNNNNQGQGFNNNGNQGFRQQQQQLVRQQPQQQQQLVRQQQPPPQQQQQLVRQQPQQNSIQTQPQQFQSQIQTTRLVPEQDRTRTTTSIVSSSSPAPTFASSSFSTSAVTTSLAPSPSTRQPRILGSSPNLVSNRFSGQRDREGRDGHSGGDNGYHAPPPEPAYHAPTHEYGPTKTYKILKLTGLDTAPLPKFNYMYSTENKINVMAEGELRNVCNEDVTVMRGSYDYYGPDGVKYTVDWYADETGKYYH